MYNFLNMIAKERSYEHDNKCKHIDFKISKDYDFWIEFKCQHCEQIFHAPKIEKIDNDTFFKFIELNLHDLVIEIGPLPTDDFYKQCCHVYKIIEFHKNLYCHDGIVYDINDYNENDLISYGMKKVVKYKCIKCGDIYNELDNLNNIYF